MTDFKEECMRELGVKIEMIYGMHLELGNRIIGENVSYMCHPGGLAVEGPTWSVRKPRKTA